MKAIIVFPLVALLGACSGHSGASDNHAAAATNLQDTGAIVEKLPPGQQWGVFMRAIRDAGLSCQDVIDAVRVGDENGVPTWRAKCDDGVEHLVSIKKGGVAIVTSRPDGR
ncbi:hypothetical protein [Sphingomonas lycopersici]|uniref:Lipoprotein n=1 Tax=Sphingomonas lycopersici TaxID=2951807 RepID=A0AA41ZE86_9SPHN|nr:hypothetical protein [Sphingomonas lycopersici]MCW6529898.1 hypothetical protein [Sphingomonas lycopersici]MCW6535299.1 hypothetical protein [Sphingomonas lycopersici]